MRSIDDLSIEVRAGPDGLLSTTGASRRGMRLVRRSPSLESIRRNELGPVMLGFLVRSEELVSMELVRMELALLSG